MQRGVRTFIGVRQHVRGVHVADVEDERTVGTAEVLLALAAQRAQRLDVVLHLLPREAQRAAVDALVAAHVVEVHVPGGRVTRSWYETHTVMCIYNSLYLT